MNPKIPENKHHMSSLSKPISLQAGKQSKFLRRLAIKYLKNIRSKNMYLLTYSSWSKNHCHNFSVTRRTVRLQSGQVHIYKSPLCVCWKVPAVTGTTCQVMAVSYKQTAHTEGLISIQMQHTNKTHSPWRCTIKSMNGLDACDTSQVSQPWHQLRLFRWDRNWCMLQRLHFK